MSDVMEEIEKAYQSMYMGHDGSLAMGALGSAKREITRLRAIRDELVAALKAAYPHIAVHGPNAQVAKANVYALIAKAKE